jgi:PAS domain S-box-containing protein/putative nucleotidyltransferase with HDIG domain
MSEPVRILIIEDIASDFDLAQREIRKAVSECVFQRVQTRDDFLRALETFQPDLILSDYQMPAFDGLTALKLAQDRAKLTPFIIWTGTMGEDNAVEMMRTGAVNYILKENIKRLGPAVAHALEERRLLLEHKQAEETIHNNEKRFRALIENGRDNISLLAVDGTLLWESPATVRGLGYAQDEFVGHNMFELMHPDDLEWTSELYAKLLQEPGSRQDGVFRLRHNDGSWRWNEATVTNMLNEPGVNAIVVNYRDITERKQAEDALRESQIKYKNLVETTHDLIWSVDAEGRITFLNRAAKEIYGYEPEELIGHSFFELMDPQYYHRDLKKFKETVAQADEFKEREMHVLHRDGRQIILSSNSLVLHDADGNVVNITGSSHDITERKQTEEMLEKERNLLRTLIDNLPDRIFVMDTQGHKTLSNAADWKASGGETMEDVLGKTDFDTYPPELAQEFWALDKAVLDSGEPVINYEEPGLDSEGNQVWILSTKVPLHDREGKVAGLVGIGRDITARKRAEMEHQALLEIMQGLVNKDDLQESLKLIHRSVASVIYAENFFVVFYNKNSGLFEEIYSVDKYDEPAPPSALEKSITSYVFRSGEPLLLTQDLFDKLAEQGEVELVGTNSESWLGVPLKTQNGIIGVIAVQDYENPDRYTEGDKNFLALIGSQVALAIERKEAEEALRQSENRYSLASKATNDVIWEWDQETDQLFWNENAQSIFGYPTEEIGMYETWWEDHIHADDRERVLSKLNALIAGDQAIWNDEYRFLRKDGSYAFIIDRAYVERDASGKPLRVIGAMSDITERKRAEDQLNYHARLLRHINDAVIATDDQLHITAWNRAAEKMYGWRREEVMGRTLSEILSYDLTDEQRQEARDLLTESMTSRSERIHRHRDGRTLYVESNTIALLNEHGRMTGYVSVNRDITERKRAEKALHQSEEQYRSLFEDSPISLWVEDFSAVKQRLDELKEEGILNIPAYCREHPSFVTELAGQVRILDVNNATLKLYHARQKSELLGSLADVFHIMLPEQFESELIQIASGRLNFEREQVDQTLTGEKIHVNIRWSVAPGYEDSLAQVLVSTVDITERKQAEEQIQLQLQRVRALRAIDIAISSSFDLNLTLSLLLDHVIAQLHTDAAAILLFHSSTRTLEHAASRGFRSTAIREARLRLGEGYAGKAVLERRMIHISNLVETDSELAALSLKTENFIEYYCVPLIVKGEVKGVLEIFHRSVLSGDPEWLDFLETLAGQAAIAIDNATLFEDVQLSNRELFQAYDATIEGWSHALDLRDKETEGHTLRVTETTMELARKFDFSDEQLRHIRWGALLHDIGKMGVPDHILLKPDKLTDEEWTSMKKHPVFALEMLSPIAYLKSALDIPYCHHEKWDGTGYPRGLKGEVIPLAARLFAIVDVWDALRSDRPYRKAWSVEKTLEHIKSLSGIHFDPKVVEYFLEMIEQPN